MIHVKSLDEIDLHESWLAIGVFDGVHRGHQRVIRALVDGAQEAGSPSAVVTFWPHPATVLGRGVVRCLTTSEERAELLGSLGVETVITQLFNAALADTSARDFVTHLRKRLDFRHLLIGYDFALGKGREGNTARLREYGQEMGYTVDVIPALGDESGVISSTEIRKLVATGDVSEAAKLLGRPFSLHGPVVHGDGRGHDLGFPTANIEYPSEKMLPSNGVYACWAWLGGDRYAAAVNVGTRPQFHEVAGPPLVEAYLIGFEREIYREKLRLDFVARLRNELKFASVQALVDQIGSDVSRAETLLAMN
jgi:riboflavin kinase/FMN adenylyltransferase